MFTTQELRDITALINRANITGQEALAVALLMQKIQKAMIEVPVDTSNIASADSGN